MIIVGRVVVGPEHGAETAAARFVQRAQEILRWLVAIPSAIEHDAAPVGEHEARNVDRVRIGVLRQPARAAAIDVAATVGAVGFDLHDLGPEKFPRRGLHRILRPGGEILRRSEEHTSELQSLMRISYAVFCLKKNKTKY